MVGVLAIVNVGRGTVGVNVGSGNGVNVIVGTTVEVVGDRVGSAGVGEVADVQAEKYNARAIKASIDLFIL